MKTAKRNPRGPQASADDDDEWAQAARAVHEARRQETSDRLLNLIKGACNTLNKRDDWLTLGLAIHSGYSGRGQMGDQIHDCARRLLTERLLAWAKTGKAGQKVSAKAYENSVG